MFCIFLNQSVCDSPSHSCKCHKVYKSHKVTFIIIFPAIMMKNNGLFSEPISSKSDGEQER